MAQEEGVIKLEKSKPKSKKGLLLIIIALVLLLFLVAAYFALRTGLLFDLLTGFGGGETSSPTSTMAALVPEHMYEMPDILVNLDDDTARTRFLSVKFHIGSVALH